MTDFHCLGHQHGGCDVMCIRSILRRTSARPCHVALSLIVVLVGKKLARFPILIPLTREMLWLRIVRKNAAEWQPSPSSKQIVYKFTASEDAFRLSLFSAENN